MREGGGAYLRDTTVYVILVVARLTKEIYISNIGQCPPFICLVQQYPSSILVINISVTIDNSYKCVILGCVCICVGVFVFWGGGGEFQDLNSIIHLFHSN